MDKAEFNSIDTLFCSLVEKKRCSGEHSLIAAETVVLSVWHASGIIENGGFGYFYEHDLDAETVATAYDKIGCAECAEIIRLSLSLFPDFVAVGTRDERVEFVVGNRELFTRLSERFWELDKGMQSRLAAYIKSNLGC
jgi:hypothetical protein